VIFVDEAAEHITTPDRVNAAVRRTLLPRQGNAQREAAVRSLVVVCAGINRHGGGDERALHRRSSDPR
jgi:hypothetical protein